MMEKYSSSAGARERTTLSSRQIGAIVLAREIGEKLATEHPEMSEDYRNGLSISEIIDKYSFFSLGHTESVTMSAIYHAICILITQEERERLNNQFTTNKRHKAGMATFQRNAGIFSLSDKEMDEVHRKGGLAVLAEKKGIHAQTHEEQVAFGKRMFELKKGIHALSANERKAIVESARERKVGLFSLTREQLKQRSNSALLAQGKTPWITNLVDPETGLNEVDYLIYLSKRSDCQHNTGRWLGRPCSSIIASTINKIFHGGAQVRSEQAVRGLLFENRKGRKF